MEAVCQSCGAVFKKSRRLVCPYCGGLVLPRFDMKWEPGGGPGIWRYAGMMPRLGAAESLYEGGTPLISSKASKDLRVWFKDETRNPTGSFRDRAAAVMVSDALAQGYKRVVLASDGNTAASVAAYAARAGLGITAYLPSWVESEKVLLIKSFGARVLLEEKPLEQLIEYAEKRASKDGLYNATSSLNYMALEGLKTIAFEIYEALGDAARVVYVPLGSGLTYLSLFVGFSELAKMGLLSRIPRLIGVETCGRPLYSGALYGAQPCGEELLPGLRYFKPAIEEHVLKAIEMAGEVVVVKRREVIEAAELLSKREGLFAEASAAVSYAGFLKAPLDSSVVLVSSHGLKSPSAYTKARRLRFTEPFPGVTKRLIVEVLRQEPGLTAYEIWRRLGVDISPQAVYQHLWQLARLGILRREFVEGHWRYYPAT